MVNGHDLFKLEEDKSEPCECGNFTKWFCQLWPTKPISSCKKEEDEGPNYEALQNGED